MKKLKKGPELKMPELKTPDFLLDLYYDLRDRRLLPFVALAVVAIAAVPFLLGGKSDEQEAPASGGLAALGSAKTSKLTVVEATPGLRDYRKRLGHRSPTNPFKQRYTGLPASAQVEGTQSGGEGSGSSGGEGGSFTVTETTETTQVPEGSGSPEAGEAGGEGSGRKLELVLDVQIAHSEKTPDGGEKMSEWEARHDVPVLAQLPSKKAPVVTVLGMDVPKERFVFLVSHGVKSISGEYSCAIRTEVCELLEVGKGVLLEFAYEPTGVRYAIKVTNAAVIPRRKHASASSSRAPFALSQAGAADAYSFSK